MKLLCLSEDEALGNRVCSEAFRLNWGAVCVSDRKQMAQAVHQHDPDVLLIEINNMSDIDWWVDASLESKRPVIFINEELTEEFLARALDSGADGFLPKHLFSSRHFEARLNSLMRRQAFGQAKRFVERLNLLVDSERNHIEVAGRAVELTLTEFKILRELATEENAVTSRLEIQTRVFGQAQMGNRSLDVHICAIRKKINRVGLDIDSVRRVGYRLKALS